jgi:hypothetical protein
MTRKMDRRVLVFVLTLGLFLAGSGVAQSENGDGLYTVHATTGRVTIANEDCQENGCMINYEIINTGKLARILCDADDERLPPSFTLATFIACDDRPNVMIGVWDVLGQERVCDSLYLYSMAEASTEGNRNRGKAELLLVTEESFPMYASARGRFGPLPRRFDMDMTCWSDYRTSAISGALAPWAPIKGGTLRGGGVIGLYGDFPR